MENKNYKIELTENAVKNMMSSYVNHKKIMMEIENECDEDELYEDGNYNYHKGYCESAETWMRTIGISQQCSFIEERLYD